MEQRVFNTPFILLSLTFYVKYGKILVRFQKNFYIDKISLIFDNIMKVLDLLG